MSYQASEKKLLLASTMIAGFAAATLASVPAYAQTTPQAPAETVVVEQAAQDPNSSLNAQGTAPDEDEVEAVVVTGSRIRRDTFNAPVPIGVVTGQQIRESGQATLYDVIQDLPQVNANQNQQTTSATLFLAGQARVDLRGLGATRTLVLVDGRRHVFSDASSPAVDLNVIPSMMIDRIETVTGATSAVYGSDAIAGVVNLIMKRQHDGLDLDAQVGISQEGDGEEQRYSALWGSDFLGGRLSVLIGGEYARQEPVFTADRDWINPGIRRNTLVSPQPVILNSRTRGTPTATFQLRGFAGGLGGTSATPQAVAIDYRDRNIVTALSADCAPTTVRAVCQDEVLPYGNSFRYVGVLQGAVERGAIRGYTEYDLTDKVKIFAEATFAQTEGFGYFGPAFSNADGSGTMGAVRIAGDNPFLNGPGVTAARLRTEFLAAGLTLTSASIANVSKTFIETGPRDVATDRQTIRAVVGMEGEFSAIGREVNWDWYYQMGKLEGSTNSLNVPYPVRVRQAFDATTVNGVAVCRDVTARAAGCVPWDVVNGPSPEAVAWVNANTVTDSEVEQRVAAVNAVTELFQLPAGPLSVAVGFEHREEESLFVQDALGASGQLFFNAIGTRGGEFSVSEYYGEIAIPILKDLPFAQELTFEAAARVSDYSTVGQQDQYRIAGSWAPFQDLRFRASSGTAVRAPNIVELFSPSSRNFTTLAVDACDRAAFAGATAAQQAARRINCGAAISGYDPNTFVSNIGPGRSSLALLQGGNVNLGPENARTEQFGFVLEPRWVPGLQISFDHFNYVIDDYISTLPITNVFTLCYDSPLAITANAVCGLIKRDPTGASLVPAGGVPGGVSEVILTNQNIASLKNKGYDVAVAYRFDLVDAFNFFFGGRGGEADWGRFALRLDATRAYKWAQRGSPADPFIEFAGVVTNATPEWKVNLNVNYALRDLTVGLTTRWYDSMRVSTAFTPAQLDPYFTGEHFEHDVRMSYRFSERLGVRAGIINVTDEIPPQLPEIYQGTGQGASMYDNRGRFFYVGASFAY